MRQVVVLLLMLVASQLQGGELDQELADFKRDVLEVNKRLLLLEEELLLRELLEVPLEVLVLRFFWLMLVARAFGARVGGFPISAGGGRGESLTVGGAPGKRSAALGQAPLLLSRKKRGFRWVPNR